MEKPVIGIIGVGMIGNSTAVLTTMHGCRTICYARSAHKIPQYREGFHRMYREMIAQGILTEAQADICGSYLEYATGYEGLADCDVIFEAIAEDLEQKKQCYTSLEKNCPHLKVIASCSSSIVADALAGTADRYADRIIVAHPFFPVHMVPYFELCAAEKTDEAALQYAMDVLRFLDRKPVLLKKPNPGFIGNYLQFALWAAALKLVEEGVCEPEDIDTCLNYSFCPRYTSIGIFQHFDNGGYMLNRSTCDAVFPRLPRYDAAPPLVVEKAESPDAWGARAPGRKGFYDWNDVDMVAYQKKVNAPYWRFIDWELPTEPQK